MHRRRVPDANLRLSSFESVTFSLTRPSLRIHRNRTSELIPPPNRETSTGAARVASRTRQPRTVEVLGPMCVVGGLVWSKQPSPRALCPSLSSIRPWSGLQWRPFAFGAELAGCKQLFLRGQHRRKLCQNADEPDNQAEEYDFFHGCPPRINSTIPDETPRFQVAWNRSAAAGARKPCIQDTRDVGNFL